MTTFEETHLVSARTTVTVPDSINVGSAFTVSASSRSSSTNDANVRGMITVPGTNLSITLSAKPITHGSSDNPVTSTQSWSITIPTSWWNSFPSTTSFTINIVMYLDFIYGGSGSIEDRTITREAGSKSYSVNATQDHFKPTFTNSISSLVDTPTTWSSGYYTNLTKLKFDITNVSARYGATIRNYKIEFDNLISNSNTLSTGIVTTAGDHTAKFTVTDSRGFVTSTTRTVKFLAYSPPTLSGVSAIRSDSNGTPADEGTNARITLTGTYSSLSEQNTCKYRIQAREITTEYSTLKEEVLTSSPQTIDLTTDALFSTEKSYDILVTVYDDANQVSNKVVLDPAFFTMDFLAGGKGIAFGQACSEDGFVCNMDANFYKDFNISGNISSSNRSNVNSKINFLGVNLTGGTANDTRAFWQDKGTGYAFFTATNQLNGQPEQYGFLLNLVYASEVHQEFWVQNNGKHWRRGGNGDTSAMPGWTEIYDSNTPFIRAVNANGYQGLAGPDGNTSDWIRTTSSGLIPYSGGQPGSGSLGTDWWRFNQAHIQNIYRAGSYIQAHVIDSGSSGQWRYIKWSNGLALCWFTGSDTLGTDSNWGSVKYNGGNGYPRRRYPFDFSEKPSVFFYVDGTNGDFWTTARDDGDQWYSPSWYVISPSIKSGWCHWSIFAIGRIW